MTAFMICSRLKQLTFTDSTLTLYIRTRIDSAIEEAKGN